MKKLGWWLGGVFAVLAILVLVALFVFRFGSPWVVKHTQFISTILTRQLGVPVSIRGAKIKWEGTAAILDAEQISIASRKDLTHPALVLQHVHLRVDGWHILQHSSLVLDNLSWHHALAVVGFDKNNKLMLGYPNAPVMFKKSSGSSFDLAKLPFSSDSALSLQDTTLQLVRSNTRKTAVYIDSLTLIPGLSQRLRVKWALAKRTNWQITEGSWQNKERGKIQAFFSLKQLNIGPLLSIFSKEADYFGTSLVNLQSRWSKKGLFWSGGWNNLSVSLNWNKKNRLSVEKSTGVLVDHAPTRVVTMLWPTIKLNGQQPQPFSTKLIIKDKPDGKRFTLMLPKLALKTWIPFIASAMNADVRKKIEAMKLVGAINALQLQAELGKAHTMSASALLENIGWADSKNVPGFADFSGKLSYDFNKQAAGIELDIKHGQFNWPAMFPEKWTEIDATGKLGFSKQKSGWKIGFSQVHYRDNTVTLTANGVLNFDKNFLNPHFAWGADFSVNNLVRIKAYLPYKMNVHTRAWLNAAFIKGYVKHANMSWKGPLKGFPYPNNEGQWKLYVPVAGMTMHYSPRWPLLTKAIGQFWMHNTGIKFSASTADLEGNTITDASGYIPTVDHAILYVKGHTSTQLQNIQHFIDVAPVPWGKDLDVVRLTGPASANINLQADVSKKHGAVFLKGDVTLQNAGVGMPAWGIDVTHVNGVLNFTEQGIAGENLHIHVLNAPAITSIKTTREKGGKTRLDLKVSGLLPMAELGKKMQFALLPYFHGKTNYTATLVVGGLNPAENQFTMRTSMRGVSVGLPEPFKKSSQTVVPTKFSMSLAPTQPLTMTFSYGSLVQAIIRLERQGEHTVFDKGSIVIGRREAVLPKKKGLSLTGTIDTLNAKAWMPALTPFFVSKEGVDKEGEEHGVHWSSIQLDIKNFLWGNDNFSAINLSVVPSQLNWKIDLKTKYGLAYFVIPNDKKKQWALDFDHFNWQPIYQKEAMGHAKKEAQEINWLSVPAIKFACIECCYGKIKLGTINATYQVVADHSVAISNWLYEGTSVDSKFSWGEKKPVQLIGKATVTNLGTIANNFSSKKYVENGTGNITFGLSWPGSPFDVSLPEVSGLFRVGFHNIRFINLPKKVKSGLGLAKLINTLSFQHSLPILNLVQKGMYVRDISFMGESKSGVISTPNFKLRSPVMDVEADGDVNLIKKTIAMKLVVQPQVTGSLPIIAAIAGGPLVGLFAYALNQVIEPLVGRAVELHYTISGSLDNPTVKKAK